MNGPGLAGLRARMAALAGRPASAAVSEAAAASLRSDRFRLEREPDWQRLEAIVARLESGRTGAIADADLLALPVLYRGAVASLSVARATMLDAATLAWLESLVQRAWFQLNGPRQGLGQWFAGFLRGGWSRAVRGLGVDLWISLAIMVAGTVLGWWLVAADADWYGAIVPGEPGDVRVPGASRAALASVIFGHAHEAGMSAFAAALFGHNAQIAILAFALGFAFGLPTVALLLQNSLMLGAILWLYHGQGLTVEIIGWLSIHGTTELFAILLGGAAGLHVGRAIAFPGAQSVVSAAALAGRRAAVVMVGVVLMLMVAGLLEGVARQLIDSTPARLAVGGGMLAFWCGYFALAGREVPR